MGYQTYFMYVTTLLYIYFACVFAKLCEYIRVYKCIATYTPYKIAGKRH